MRYRIKGTEIRSENAAKSIFQKSEVTLDCINALPDVNAILDFGCGKLRYADVLAMKCKKLTLVDSATQVNRKQKIAGELTNIVEYVNKKWSHVTVQTIDEFRTNSQNFDFALCANVLSAIPTVRARNQVFRSISQALTKNGNCLFVTQFRNSYFTKISYYENSLQHLDGYLVKNSKGSGSFYGVISANQLSAMAKKNGFVIENAWEKGESAFLLAKQATSR